MDILILKQEASQQFRHHARGEQLGSLFVDYVQQNDSLASAGIYLSSSFTPPHFFGHDIKLSDPTRPSVTFSHLNDILFTHLVRLSLIRRTRLSPSAISMISCSLILCACANFDRWYSSIRYLAPIARNSTE